MSDLAPLAPERISGAGPVVLTCEHASAALPAWLSASADDRDWMGTHWAIDLGGAALTRALAERLDAPAVLARASRLVCDCNRSPGDPTWIRPTVEGYALSFNRGVDTAERQRRAAVLYAPYHHAIDSLLVDRLARHQPSFLFSVHTFTPDYEGERREMEAGVLFDLHDDLGADFAEGLRAAGLDTAINAPWSGKAGLAYSPDRHGRAHHLPYLEIEVRNDLLDTGAKVARIADLLARQLRAVAPG